ncbi:hypothetical protein JGU66_25705 [Myxococcaceae bacterium JPH2]|nr:hypothetical protein [Myxococcaceae bacterium JPH2]
MPNLYKRIEVIRRTPNRELIIYRCLEVLGQGGYVVQSADRLREPFSQKDREVLERQFWELLSETPPEERSAPHATLEQAIAAFESEFA